MTRISSMPTGTKSRAKGGLRLRPPLPLFILQPILARIVRRIGAENPDMFNRLGPHTRATFLIDPTNLPFVLLLQPDPENLSLRASTRAAAADAAPDASISGKFMDLLQLVDGDLDGDALFFSRDLVISGSTEAVVCLRNALDDVEGSIAEMAAAMLGAPGKALLKMLRRNTQKTNPTADTKATT